MFYFLCNLQIVVNAVKVLVKTESDGSRERGALNLLLSFSGEEAAVEAIAAAKLDSFLRILSRHNELVQEALEKDEKVPPASTVAATYVCGILSNLAVVGWNIPTVQKAVTDEALLQVCGQTIMTSANDDILLQISRFFGTVGCESDKKFAGAVKDAIPKFGGVISLMAHPNIHIRDAIKPVVTVFPIAQKASQGTSIDPSVITPQAQAEFQERTTSLQKGVDRM